MIQRIQTIFILASIILIGMMFSMQFADIAYDKEIYKFDISGITKNGQKIFSGISITILAVIILAVHILVFFSFKRRIRQIRLLTFTIFLLLGLFGIILYFAYASFGEQVIAFKMAVAFPLVVVVLDFLAIRAIGKDEALIRSIDRLR